MQVGEYCNREVVIVNKDESLVSVARLMRNHHVGDGIVVEPQGNLNIPVAIVTDRDIVISLLAEDIDIHTMNVDDIVKSPLISVKEDEDLLACIQMMRNDGVRRMPVVDYRNALVGIITLDDIIEILSEIIRDINSIINRERAMESQLRLVC